MILDITLARVFAELRAIRFALTAPWRFRFTALSPNNTLVKDPSMFILSAVEKVDLTIRPVDIKGNPAPVDSVPEWSMSPEGLASLLVAPDGMSATLVADGPAGAFQLNVTADAHLGEGVTQIVGVLDVQVVPAEAVSMDIVAGTPTLS